MEWKPISDRERGRTKIKWEEEVMKDIRSIVTEGRREKIRTTG